ncbi:unnamed protein product, partial [Protopolystoma xenopodis]
SGPSSFNRRSTGVRPPEDASITPTTLDEPVKQSLLPPLDSLLAYVQYQLSGLDPSQTLLEGAILRALSGNVPLPPSASLSSALTACTPSPSYPFPPAPLPPGSSPPDHRLMSRPACYANQVCSPIEACGQVFRAGLRSNSGPASFGVIESFSLPSLVGIGGAAETDKPFYRMKGFGCEKIPLLTEPENGETVDGSHNLEAGWSKAMMPWASQASLLWSALCDEPTGGNQMWREALLAPGIPKGMPSKLALQPANRLLAGCQCPGQEAVGSELKNFLRPKETPPGSSLPHQLPLPLSMSLAHPLAYITPALPASSPSAPCTSPSAAAALLLNVMATGVTGIGPSAMTTPMSSLPLAPTDPTIPCASSITTARVSCLPPLLSEQSLTKLEQRTLLVPRHDIELAPEVTTNPERGYGFGQG